MSLFSRLLFCYFVILLFFPINAILQANPFDRPGRLWSLEQWLNVIAATLRGESPHSRRRPTRGGMDLHVNAILQANPFDRPWRKHMAKARQSVSVLPEPSLKCPSAHSCGICKFVFVCAFHSTVNWELGEVERGSKLASLTSST